MDTNSSEQTILISDPDQSVRNRLFLFVISVIMAIVVYHQAIISASIFWLVILGAIIFLFFGKTKCSSCFDQQRGAVIINYTRYLSFFSKQKEIPFTKISALVLYGSRQKFGSMNYIAGLGLVDGDREYLLFLPSRNRQEVMDQLQHIQKVLDKPIVEEDNLTWARHKKVF